MVKFATEKRWNVDHEIIKPSLLEEPEDAIPFPSAQIVTDLLHYLHNQRIDLARLQPGTLGAKAIFAQVVQECFREPASRRVVGARKQEPYLIQVFLQKRFLPLNLRVGTVRDPNIKIQLNYLQVRRLGFACLLID